MYINDYPSYIDENFRMNFVKNSRERVYWISPKFSKDEIDVVNDVKKKLPNNCVNSHEYCKSTLSDRGHCFYLEDEHSCIDIQIITKDKDIIYDSLLIVDSIACIYNHESLKEIQNVIFIDKVDEVKLIELEKEIQNNQIIQVNLFENESIFDGKGTIKKCIENGNLNNSFSNEGLADNVIITTDIKLKMIQDKICKVIIRTPGIRTKDSNIDISSIVDIIGRPSQDTVDRLALRWKIFGDDYNVGKDYKRLYLNLERIKKKFTIMINSCGRLILEKDKSEFEIEINKFKEKIKQEAINLIEEKIDNSKLILKDLIIDFYKFSKLKEEEFKTCTVMELESIIENLKAKFPTVDRVVDKCDVVYEYISIEAADITNKEFCKKLVIKVRESEKDLAGILDIIIKS